MAAGLGFKTFTTGEVLTAADTNGYLMQGVNVFADAAARTAAITSPQEGQMSYLKDTNSTEYYSGSAWVAVGAASGGMTLISTTSFNGTAGVTLSSIPATYNHLQIVVRDFLPANDFSILKLRFNGDSASRYTTSSARYYGSQVDDGTAAFGATELYASSSNDNAVSNGLTMINVFDYANTVTWKFIECLSLGVDGTTTTSAKYSGFLGAYNQTAAISSIYLFSDAGNITSGTVLLYGVK